MSSCCANPLQFLSSGVNITHKYHSISLALIDVMDDIYQQFDSGNNVIGIYLDLQKAFDTVDHSILLAKLYNYSVRGNVYNWLL